MEFKVNSWTWKNQTICEDENGNYYVVTKNGLCKIDFPQNMLPETIIYDRKNPITDYKLKKRKNIL